MPKKRRFFPPILALTNLKRFTIRIYYTILPIKRKTKIINIIVDLLSEKCKKSKKGSAAKYITRIVKSIMYWKNMHSLKTDVFIKAITTFNNFWFDLIKKQPNFEKGEKWKFFALLLRNFHNFFRIFLNFQIFDT